MATQETDQEILASGAAYAGAGLGSAVALESPGLGEPGNVRARGQWEQFWRRFKQDRAAVISFLFIIFLLLLSFVGAPIAAHILGHGPNDLFNGSIDTNTQLPLGPLSHFSTQPYPGAVGHFHQTFFVLGADSELGRDEFLRLLYGGQTSLEVALGGMIMSVIIGVVLGASAGYFGGMIDTIVSRLTEIVMAFPLLLFLIALASTIGPRIDGITFGVLGNGVVTIVLVLGLFGWFYPARIVRARVLSLREKEFVEAARMVGASDVRIIRSHLLPHLVAPVVVYATLIVAQNILAEAGLSFLGVGIKQPTSSWGNLLSDSYNFYLTQPWLIVWPGLAVLVTTLAFNLFGDGLRDALDPRTVR